MKESKTVNNTLGKLLLFVIVFLLFLNSIHSSNWFDYDWNYRKKINLTGKAGAGDSYQILLKIGESLASADTDFHLENNSDSFPIGHNQSGDIRFTAADGVTLLNIWVEKVASDSPSRVALIWIKTISLETDTHIYCYYGNLNAENVSNGDSTFEFFDDFTNDLSKWRRDKTSGIYPKIPVGETYVRCGGGTTTAPFGHTSLGSSPTYSDFYNNAVRFRARNSDSGIGEVAFRGVYIDNGDTINTGYKGRFDARAGEGHSFLARPYISGNWYFYINNDANVIDSNTWYIYEITVYDTMHKLYSNDELKRSGIPDTYMNRGEIALQNHFGDYVDFDWVAVRKFVLVEPSFSNAESQTGHPPEAPSYVNATAILDGDDTGVLLNWTHNTESDTIGYNIYRTSTPPDNYLIINNSIITDSNYFLDTNVTKGDSYFYKITCLNAPDNESYKSDSITASSVKIKLSVDTHGRTLPGDTLTLYFNYYNDGFGPAYSANLFYNIPDNLLFDTFVLNVNNVSDTYIESLQRLQWQFNSPILPKLESDSKSIEVILKIK